jgi:hypothetical protein
MRRPKVCSQSQSFFYQLPNRRMVQTTYEHLIMQCDADCYFCPNVCTTESILDLQSLEWFFVDIDAGRTKTGAYYSERTIKQKKKKLRRNIKERAELDMWYDLDAPMPWDNWKAKDPEFYSIAPTVAVETRNGYHLYWRIVSCPVTAETLSQWNRVQWCLRQLFDADPLALKANQLMRVPDTIWRKPYEGQYTAFECEEVDLDICVRADALPLVTLADYFNLLDKRVYTDAIGTHMSYSAGEYTGEVQSGQVVVPDADFISVNFDDKFEESIHSLSLDKKLEIRVNKTLELMKEGVVV